MKLTDISKVNSDVLNTKLEAQTGWKLQLESMDAKKAAVMLESVNSKLNAIRTSSQIHTSEKDPRYTTMLMTQQILESFLEEAKKDGKKLPPWLNKDKDKNADGEEKVDEAKPKAKKQEKVGDAQVEESRVDELKTSTLKSYKNKAAADGYKHYNATDYDGPSRGGGGMSDDEIDAHDAVVAKRRAGVQRAEKKIAQREPIRTALKKGVSAVAKNRTVQDIAYGVGPKTGDAVMKAANAGNGTYMPDPVHRMTKKGLEKKAADLGGRRGGTVAQAIKSRRGATESKMVDLYIRKLILEDQVTQAQSVMAAKDMVDSIQDMLEDLSKMLNEQLPPLVDNVRSNIGDEQASGFQQAASGSLNTLLQAAQAAREEINNAVLSLTGEGPAPMSMPDELPPNDAADPALGGDIGAEADDVFGASDAAAGGELPLGREKRI